MSNLEQSIQELEIIKQKFKNNLNSEGISTTDIEFRNYPELLEQTEKKLQEQTKTATPTTDAQTISADDGYKLVQVNVKAIQTEEKTITNNGTYIPSEGKFIDKVIVNVEGAEVEEMDTSDSNLVADDVLSGYNFYDNTGTKSTGTIQSMEGGTFTSNQILETAGKYLTSDIVVSVPNGDSRIENDSLYKMKSIDFMRGELGDEYPISLPTDADYEEQQIFVNNNITDSSSNITDFSEYVAMNCEQELFKTLQFKDLSPLKTMTFDGLVNMMNNITYSNKQPLASTVNTEQTTATASKVRNGRLFYGSDGNKTIGTIDTNVGRRVDINQTIPTANKYITDNIEIYVPAGGKNPNETFNEMKSLDKIMYEMGDINYNELPTDEEYLEQQSYVNNLIYEIQGAQI